MRRSENRTIAIADWQAFLLGALVQNRLRTSVAVFAIAIGVALGLAVQLVNRSAIDELTQSVRVLSGDADLAVRGPRNGFDELTYADLARDNEVAVASPVVELEVRVAQSDQRLRVLGLDAFRAGAIAPGLVGDASDRFDTLRGDTLFLSNAALAALSRNVGETLILDAGNRAISFRIAGTIAGAARERLGVMDIAAAQDAFDWRGRLSRIDIRLRPGVTPQSFIARWQSRLPAGVAIDRPDATLRATESISRSYRVNLNVLALVGLFTGGLLVFTTQALAVIRRRTQFALFRTLGMTRARLARLCMLEGALIGALGSVIGIAFGYAIAYVALRVVGADLGSGFFRSVNARVDFDPLTLATFVALGVATAALASLLPAREAARASAAQALKAGDEEHALRRLRSPAQGLCILGIGVALLWVPAIDGLPFAGYAAIGCFLIGTLLLMPWLARFVLARVPTPSQAPAALAIAQLRGAPGQVSVSLAAIVASVSLMVSMAIMVASFRQSLDDWLTHVLPADVYARARAPDVAPLSPDDQRRLAEVDGVLRIEFFREAQLLLDPARPRVVLIARPIDEGSASSRLALTDPATARPAGAPPAAWVNEAMVDLYGFVPGKTVTLPIAGRDVAFFIAGVWRDYARPQGAVVIDRDAYAQASGDRAATSAAVWLQPGVDANATRSALQRTLEGDQRLEVAAPSEMRALALQSFDRTFAVTYALEAAAVAIGLAGLSSAFSALVLGRRREFGVLRHLGMTRKQVGAMLASEGFFTSALGTIVGAAIGAAISLVLVYIVNKQSFHWGMDIHVPWRALVLLAVGVIVLSTVTAVVSGRRAMSADVIRAVREDW
ncbi:MAG TPA: FtsX-like permease family protein [Casimicrobiaceae bacterium]|nr:FtsX-like permease family protein [Casimicrobiaceae bacterium]